MPEDRSEAQQKVLRRRAPRPQRRGAPRNAVAVQSLRLDIEPFSEFAWQEIGAVREAEFGVCALPQCSASFNPHVRKGRFCSDQCREADVREMRIVGHKIAPALLAMREGKYTARGTPQHSLFLAAWRYLGRVGTEWRQDRAKRRKEATE